MASMQGGVCMIGGDGETSYAQNSAFQSGMQSRLVPLVGDAISDLCRVAVPAGCLRLADLGCASGPNALASVSAAVGTARRHQSSAAAERCREICVYLNDIPDNDFNTVFKEVPSFLRQHGEVEPAGAGGPTLTRGPGPTCRRCAVTSEDLVPLVMVFGAPGSFYGRFFPAKSLHLVCSSFSLHWLSQVPQELVDGVLINKGTVWAGRTSTPAVTAAYTRQFEQDFKLFLASRAEEIVPGGWMVLSLVGRPARDFSQNRCSEFIAEILQDMASQGVIAAEEVDSFNEPFYSPCLEELRGTVALEGSFEVVRVESHGFVDRGPRGDAARRAAMARSMRVLDEAMLARHFRVDGVGDAYARAVEARYMGPAAEDDMAGVVLFLSLRRK